MASDISGSPLFIVHFFRGGTDITTSVRAGTYAITDLATGGQVSISVEVEARWSIAQCATRTIDVLVTSESAAGARDLVRGHVTRT